jgi:DNA repair protein RadC
VKTIRWLPKIEDDGEPDIFIRSVKDVYQLMLDKGYRDAPKESLIAILLDEENRVMGHEVIATGSRDMSLAPIRESFSAAVQMRAASILVCHNHPPGDPTPSGADKKMTAAFGLAGELFGIRLFDHVIVAAGSQKYYSFRKEDILDADE